MEEQMRLTITFMDGETKVMEFAPRENAGLMGGSKLNSFLNSSYLPLEVDGELVIYPTNNMRSIKITPAPKAMLASVAAGMKMVTES
jgi:hypothetical protein